jgi:hypothetical protein
MYQYNIERIASARCLNIAIIKRLLLEKSKLVDEVIMNIYYIYKNAIRMHSYSFFL